MAMQCHHSCSSAATSARTLRFVKKCTNAFANARSLLSNAGVQKEDEVDEEEIMRTMCTSYWLREREEGRE